MAGCNKPGIAVSALIPVQSSSLLERTAEQAGSHLQAPKTAGGLYCQGWGLLCQLRLFLVFVCVCFF